MNWYLILYIFVAIVIGTYPPFKLSASGRNYAAIMYLILIIAVLVLFGLRWFEFSSLDKGNSSWPPVINACSDYLTYFNRTPTAGSPSVPTCIDLIGVSKNGTLKKWLTSHSATNPPSGPGSDSYYFSLVTTGPSRNAELCKRSIDNGLTWEGITNGESCYIAAVPGSPEEAAALGKEQCNSGA